jgi:hypothetical protein
MTDRKDSDRHRDMQRDCSYTLRYPVERIAGPDLAKDAWRQQLP